jgi:acyl carrier protein
MNSAEIEPELYKLIGRGRIRSMILPEERLREDLSIDSLTFVRLVIDIERTFGIRFGDDMLTIHIFEKVKNLSQYVMTLVEEKSHESKTSE